LALLQILLYDQQNVLSLFKNNNCQCDMNIHNDDDNTDRDITLQAIAPTAGNDDDVYHLVIKVYDMTNDTIVSVSVADKATFSVVDEATTSVTVTTQGNDDDTRDTSYQSSFNQHYYTLWSFTAGANDEATTTVVLITAS